MLVDTAVTVPVNACQLIDDTDYKSVEASVAYNATGLALYWNFVTVAGVITQTAVTPTDAGGDYDWTAIGNGMYKIEIPASGGASINNDAEGYGYFSGIATGVLSWRGPTIQFSPANVVNSLVVGSDKLDANTAEIAGTAITSTGTRVADNFSQYYDQLTVAQTISTDVLSVIGSPAGGSVAVALASIKLDSAELVARLAKISKNTALAGFTFPMLSSTDHATPTTGLTVTATRSIDGAAFAACTNAVAEVGSGGYKIDLAAADLNGNSILFLFAATGADPQIFTIVTQPT